MARRLPSKQFQATVHKHEPWKDHVPAKSIMSIHELYQRVDKPKFHQYLRSSENSTAPYHSAEAHQIRHDMESIANDLTAFLGRTYKVFSNCKLIKAGSSYEGVKLGPPDEFDFMIEIPAIRREDTIGIKVPSLQSFPYKAKINDRAFIADIYEKGDESRRHDHINFWTSLKKIITECVKESIGKKKCWEMLDEASVEPPSGMKWDSEKEAMVHVESEYPKFMKDLSWVRDKKAATTLFMRWSGKEYRQLDVSVDFCMAVPVWVNNQDYTELHYLPEMSADHARRSGKYMRCHVLLLSDFWCRLSLSTEEMRIMKQYPYPAGQNKCMRILKYLRDCHIPQVDPEPLYKFPSYWIKTVMYNMYKRYPSDASWQGDELAIRTVEALDILEDATARLDLPNHFIPSHNLLAPSSKCVGVSKEIRKIKEIFLKK